MKNDIFFFSDEKQNKLTSCFCSTRVVYDRVKSHRLVAVFLMSAVWHGFYPGYYLAFVTAGLLVQASRMVSKIVSLELVEGYSIFRI